MNQPTSISDILGAHPWFCDCDKALLSEVEAGCRVITFSPGAIIEGSEGRPFLCILLSGSAAVYTRDEGTDLLLRVLNAGDTFGVASLFGQEPMVTRVTAVVETCALCMREDTMRHILERDARVAMRYIDFLADRIRFLNRRIACLGAGSAQRRLAAWLDTVASADAVSYELTLPMNRLSDTLGLGRASLYRAFDELTEAGYIRREGKQILFLDRDGMRTDSGLA